MSLNSLLLVYFLPSDCHFRVNYFPLHLVPGILHQRDPPSHPPFSFQGYSVSPFAVYQAREGVPSII